MTQKESLPDFPTTQDFLFKSSLYSIYNIESLDFFYDVQNNSWRVDGYCDVCGRERTFRGDSATNHRTISGPIEDLKFIHSIILRCTSDEDHIIWFSIFLDYKKIQKIGQLPSPATIAQAEIVAYKNVIYKVDMKEFNMAIGLSSHDVGIGSFVYLRRIFERLITTRFNNFKTSEQWKDEEFFFKRMDEKIEFLKSHLPNFLVKNKQIYGILSKGIHELDDRTCLLLFPILKDSILLILEEDKKKKEELERHKRLADALASIPKL